MKIALLSLLIACSSTEDDLQKRYDAIPYNPKAVMKLDSKTLVIEPASLSDCGSALTFWGTQAPEVLKKEGIKLVVCGDEKMVM
jgi:hypothetical protein